MELADQKAQIARLDSLQLPEMHVDLDLPTNTLLYCIATSDLKYADDKSYSLPRNNSVGHQSALVYGPSSGLQLAYAVKETLAMSKMKDNLELGNRFLATLYSYRSVARGIPQAHNQDPTQRLELYKLAYEVLKPEIQKLKDLQKYSVECTSVLAEVLKQLSADWSGAGDGLCFASTEFLLMLARTLDMILVLDSLKNAKASLNNDFSIYKRAAANAKSVLSDLEDENAENHALYNFLAGQNVFMQKTKETLYSIAGADEAIVDMVNHCAYLFENQLYVTPSDKHMLLKSITFGLFLLDSPGEDHDVTKKKKLRLDRLGKIIKLNPVVPFIGDMTMTLTSILFKSPRLKMMKWEADLNDENLSKTYLLSNQIDSIRNEYQQYMVTFVSTMNSIKFKEQTMEILTAEDSQRVYQTLLRGVQLLSRLTCKVLEQSSWKFNNPTNNSKNTLCPENAKLYEMAVRYNYSTNERPILCEVVGHIKSISKQLSSIKGIAVGCIQSHIHISAQMFSKSTLRDMLNHVTKKKKPVTPLVQHLFSILTEMSEDDMQRPTAATGVKSQKASALSLPAVVPKPIGISSTQIHYVRVLLSMISGDKAKGMQGGFLKEKDIKEVHLSEVAQFLSESSFYAPMMSFLETVNECGDLGELWFREFYLELTKEIQFPIEMSLPWILTNTSLETDFKPNSELLLAPFDIYNDAANKALHHLRSRFLYDEIEAEVNLCFDQFIWKLSQKVFSYFRVMASSILLDHQLKQNMSNSKSKPSKKNQKQVSQEFFEQSLLPIITQQKRFYLLGRFVNINQLVGQYCNQHLRNCIDSAISRFESSELSSIIEVEYLLKVTKYTHTLLTEVVTLDPFESMFLECDESLSLVTNNGRIVTHVVHELIADLVPNFRLDFVKRKFVREVEDDSLAASRANSPKTIPLYMFGTKQLNSLYQSIFNPLKTFIGTEHLESLIRVLGKQQIHVLVEEMTRCLDVTVNLSVNSYVKILIKGLPYSSKLPPFEFGLKGAFDYFKTILKPITDYHELKSGVFQTFRELGNTLAFFFLLDCVQDSRNFLATVQTNTVVDHSPNSLLVNALYNQGKSIDIPKGAHSFGYMSESLSKYYTTVNDTTKPSQLYLTIIEDKLAAIIDKSRHEWDSQDDTYDSKSLDQARSFYRLWSAILFAFCLNDYAVPRQEQKAQLKNTPSVMTQDLISPGNDGAEPIRFGDSMIMSGTVIVHLLKETNRFKSYDFVSFVKYLNDISGVSQVDDPLITRFLTAASHTQFIVTETLSLLGN